jgi:hypothetical protein
MADYEPPTLEDLFAYVARDLVDPDHRVWNTDQLTDYINGGIAELNRVRPLESAETIAWDEETETLPLATLVLEQVFAVELRSPTGSNQWQIPFAPSGVPGRDGWDYHGRTLWLGATWSAKAAHYTRDNDYNLVVWGYRPRDPLLVLTDVAEFLDLNDEMAVRMYARLEAYRALNMDRSLFQQWQQQANNADVSPTQLNGMLGTAESSFDRQQKRLFSPRRIPAV